MLVCEPEVCADSIRRANAQWVRDESVEVFVVLNSKGTEVREDLEGRH